MYTYISPMCLYEKHQKPRIWPKIGKMADLAKTRDFGHFGVPGRVRGRVQGRVRDRVRDPKKGSKSGFLGCRKMPQNTSVDLGFLPRKWAHIYSHFWEFSKKVMPRGNPGLLFKNQNPPQVHEFGAQRHVFFRQAKIPPGL